MLTVMTLLLCLIAIAFAASPFFQQKQEWGAELSESKLEKVTMEKEQYYQAIKDVDFEFAEGKLNEADHHELRDYYKEKAVLTIRTIDSLKKEKEGSKKEGAPSRSRTKRS